MSIARLRTLLWVFLCVTCLETNAHAGNSNALSKQEIKQGFVNGRLLAKPKSLASSSDLSAQEAHFATRLKRIIKGRNTVRVLDFDKGVDVRKTAAKLQASGLYEYVEPDYIRHAHAVPNDPQFGQQWSYQNTGQNGGTAGADIGAVAAWDVRSTTSNVVVAVIDSGLRPTHEDLAANLWVNPKEIASNGADDDGNGYVDDVNGINTLVAKGSAGDGDISDDEGHGTAVSSVIGAVGNNGKGITGVAWQTKIMSLKFNDATEVALSSNELICINYAVANGAKIINFSYGGPFFSQSEYDAIKAARDAGVIFVVSAGNDGTDNELISEFPASYMLENVVAVANTDRTDSLADSSTYGGLVELGAPGTDILTCTKDSDSSYDTLSGTSFSAPLVSGSLALVAAQFPNDTYRQLINRVLRSVDPLSSLTGKVTTGGRLDLKKALSSTSNRPFNDDFASASVLPNDSVLTRGVSIGATAETGEPKHGANGGASLWWSWTPARSGTAIVDTNGSSFDTTVAVYTGTSLNALTQIAVNDDAAGRTTSLATFGATAGVTYHIAVDGKNGATGVVSLSVGIAPSNDNFINAEVLSTVSAVSFGGLRDATAQAGEPTLSASGETGSGHTAWYKWTAPTSGNFTTTAFTEDFDALVGVFTGTSVSTLTSISQGLATTSFSAISGTTYYFAIDSGSTGLGTFVITLIQADQAITLATEIFSSIAAGPNHTLVGVDSASVSAYFSDTQAWENQIFQGSVDLNTPALQPNGSFYETSTAGFFNVAQDQTLTWSKTYPGTSGSAASPSIAADGTVYVHTNDGILHAYTQGGVDRWSVSVTGESTSSPSIAADGTIYIGSDDHSLYAINPIDGSIKWKFDSGDVISASPAIGSDGTIYFGTEGSKFYAVTPAGAQAWVYNTGDQIYSSAAIGTDGTIYFGCFDSKVYALSSTGSLVYTYTTGGPILSSPAVASDGSIFIGGYDAKLYQISSTGTLVRSYSMAASVLSSPVIVDGSVIYGDYDHNIYVISPQATLAASSWPLFRGNIGRTGRQSANTAPVIYTQPSAKIVAAGTSTTLAVNANGQDPLAFQWSFNGSAIAGANASTYIITNASSANVGSYTVTVSNGLGSVTSNPINVTVEAATNIGRISNLSARAYAGTGANTLIVGFIVGNGSGTKPILVRGIGPSLQARGVTGFIDDPALKVFAGSTVINSNDNWGTDSQVPTATAQVGAVAFTSSKDAALVINVAPGGYTAQVTAGATSTTASGVALAEFYDASPVLGADTPLLTNISARAHVGQGAQVLIVGFIINGSTPVKVLIRGLGPELTKQNVPNVLADPTMKLTTLDGTVIQQNDNWSDSTNLAEVQSAMSTVNTTVLDAGSKDAVIVTTLQPGAYTALVSGVGGTTGVALAEVYQVP